MADPRSTTNRALLASNGLRIPEALSASIGDFSIERGHRTLGPIFLGVEGGRMDRYCADPEWSGVVGALSILGGFIVVS
jgi:energy-converting hydrogenase Eha subunit B